MKQYRNLIKPYLVWAFVVIVIPLILILPGIGGLGVHGVFLAEPISNFIGGAACFTTMMITVYRKMKE